MGNFSTDILIDAPVESVWDVLADIGAISTWNPGVIASHITSDDGNGLGATRYCDLGSSNFLDEEVVQWEPRKRLTMRITNTNLPFKTADIHFALEPRDGKTHVAVAPDYSLKYGIVGNLLDTVYVQNNYRKGMESLLKGLREHVEASTEA